MAEVNQYEEQRRRQMEENKRKLDELRLHHLSAAVMHPPTPLQRSRRVASYPEQPTPLRRSRRVASHPEQPDYSDANTVRRERERLCSDKRRREKELLDHVSAAEKQRSYAVTKAEELAEKLRSDHPTFVKPMSHDCVTRATKLYIPAQFCKEHLPEGNETIVLVDEDDVEYEMAYNANKQGIYWMDAGWRGFADDHSLFDGDYLVFQLIERTKFKVHITRAISYYENEHWKL